MCDVLDRFVARGRDALDAFCLVLQSIQVLKTLDEGFSGSERNDRSEKVFSHILQHLESILIRPNSDLRMARGWTSKQTGIWNNKRVSTLEVRLKSA
jgi:hypothetical protein